jgi:hypothetical protein
MEGGFARGEPTKEVPIIYRGNDNGVDLVRHHAGLRRRPSAEKYFSAY